MGLRLRLRSLPVQQWLAGRGGAAFAFRSNRSAFGNYDSRQAVRRNHNGASFSNAERTRTPCPIEILGVEKRFYATQQHTSNSNGSNKNTKMGLFSIPGLVYPSDFQRLTKEAIQESDRLRNNIPSSIDSKSHARDVLYQLDQISRTVCNVIDAAELCRSAHADPDWRDASNNAFIDLQDYIGTLNADQRLYNALAQIELDGYYSDLSEEEKRFCSLLKREFELDGIHLPDQEREEIKSLHNTVTTVSTSSTQTTTSTSAMDVLYCLVLSYLSM